MERVYYGITHAGRGLGYFVADETADQQRVAGEMFGVAPGLIQVQGPCKGGALWDVGIPDWAANRIRLEMAAQ